MKLQGKLTFQSPVSLRTREGCRKVNIYSFTALTSEKGRESAIGSRRENWFLYKSVRGVLSKELCIEWKQYYALDETLQLYRLGIPLSWGFVHADHSSYNTRTGLWKLVDSNKLSLTYFCM